MIFPFTTEDEAIHLPGLKRSSTLTSLFSARRRAMTDPDEPDPQAMKSYN
jgi:hypothetical protein